MLLPALWNARASESPVIDPPKPEPMITTLLCEADMSLLLSYLSEYIARRKTDHLETGNQSSRHGPASGVAQFESVDECASSIIKPQDLHSRFEHHSILRVGAPTDISS